jgi:hypothetical protein
MAEYGKAEPKISKHCFLRDEKIFNLKQRYKILYQTQVNFKDTLLLPLLHSL